MQMNFSKLKKNATNILNVDRKIFIGLNYNDFRNQNIKRLLFD